MGENKRRQNVIMWKDEARQKQEKRTIDDELFDVHDGPGNKVNDSNPGKDTDSQGFDRFERTAETGFCQS